MVMLVLWPRFVEAHDTTRSGAFPTAAFIGANQRLIRELDEETVGLIRFGSIGRAVAQRLGGLNTRRPVLRTPPRGGCGGGPARRTLRAPR